jgi:hypothetical protein
MGFPPITPKTRKKAGRPGQRWREKLVLSRRPLHKENPAVFSGGREGTGRVKSED